MRHSGYDSQANLTWLSLACRRSVVRRALAYAVVVGTILISINHGDAILEGTVDGQRAAKMMLTVLVPYCVSMLSSVGALGEVQCGSIR